MTSNTPDTATARDQNSSVRVAERVLDVLSDRIRSGEYGPGEVLPTERTLAADLRVHRRSVRTAIDRLVAEGLVSRRPNCRPTVARSPSDTAEGMRVANHPTPRISTSNLIALMMWHGGGPLEHAGTSQQRIFWGMNQALTKFGYHAIFLDLGEEIESEASNAAREARHLRYIRDQGFGGALFYPYAYRHNRDLAAEVSRSVPLVMLDRRIAGVDVDFVGVENYGAVFELTRQLIAQGHRRIAHVTSTQPIQSVQDRIQGYLDAMRSADADAAPDMVEMLLHVPNFNDDRFWATADAIFCLPEGQRPTAAICFTDYMAVALAKRLKSFGLSVPGDVALTGFDNIVPTLPDGIGLTTAAQPYEQIGISAVELLLRRIKDRKAPLRSLELPVSLIARESSASGDTTVSSIT